MNTKNQAAAVSGTVTDVLDTAKSLFSTARENVQTPSGRLLMFAIRFLLSFVNLFYFKGVLRMAYYSMFYRLDIPETGRGAYCFLVVMACLFFGALMIFTRRQIVTRLVIMCSMPFYFPIFLFNYKHLVLVIPLLILIVVTYLASGTSEGPKTILGAVFLMLYLIGAFVFITVQSILQPAIEETVTERGVTPEGCYRYSIVQELDQGDGKTYVAVEPNTADVEYDHSRWYAKGFRREVYLERPVCRFEAQWSTKTRPEITRELISNNPNTTFTLNAEQMRLLGLNIGFSKEYTLSQLSRRQRFKLGFGIENDTVDSRIARFFGVTLMEKSYSVILDFDQMEELGLNPTYDMRLSRMSDENLATLGVPEINEVLTVNGKVVFRQYVAELERLFWESSRDLSAFLETNEVPEVHPEGIEIPEPAPAETTAPAETEPAETTETTAETTEAAAG